MKLWTDEVKIKSRIDTLPTHVIGQYWSLPGRCIGPGCEADHMLKYIEPEQFHGVERVREYYDDSRAAYPQLNWHHGDLLRAMSKFRDFNPGFVNADLINGARKSSQKIAQIIDLIKGFDCELNVNFVLSSRNQKPQTAAQVVRILEREPLVQNAIARGWDFEPRHYIYKRRTTTMGTFFFRRRAMRLAA